MVILDTDHVSLLEWESPEAQKLRARLQEVDQEQLAVTIVSFEEQMRGWMAYIARQKTVSAQLDAYRRLRRQLLNYCKIKVLEFEERAAIEFQRLRKLKTRIATMDLKIAAIVLVQDGTLLTRNTSDFQRIPDLKIEDWTKEPEETS